jgi:hypothetical protein
MTSKKVMAKRTKYFETFRRFDSDSPESFDIISGPFRRKKKAPVSAATAFAMIVLPDPGGPYINTPLMA